MAYLRAKQPWRTIAFVVCGLAVIALAVALIWVIVHGPTTPVAQLESPVRATFSRAA
jgi:hypothetical protein